MPFYTKQTASRLYKTCCVLSRAVNVLRLVVFFLFFCPAWSEVHSQPTSCFVVYRSSDSGTFMGSRVTVGRM